jgi:WD40 repeat protein
LETKSVLSGHTNAIWALAASPDGRLLASGDKSGAVKLWLATPAGPVRSAVRYPENARDNRGYTDDAGHVYWRDEKDRIVIAEGRSGKPTRLLDGYFAAATVIRISPDLERVAVAEPSRLVIRRTSNLDVTSETALSGLTVRSLRFAPDTRRIAVVYQPGRVCVLATDHLEADPLVELNSPASVRVTTFSPDGLFLAVGRSDGRVELLDIQHRSVMDSWVESRLWITGIAFSADGGLVAVSTEDGVVNVRDSRTRKLVKSLRSVADAYWSVGFSVAGDRIAAGTGEGTIILWDLASGEDLLTLTAHPQPLVGGLRFQADGKTLFSWTGKEYRYWTIE